MHYLHTLSFIDILMCIDGSKIMGWACITCYSVLESWDTGLYVEVPATLRNYIIHCFVHRRVYSKYIKAKSGKWFIIRHIKHTQHTYTCTHTHTTHLHLHTHTHKGNKETPKTKCDTAGTLSCCIGHSAACFIIYSSHLLYRYAICPTR